MAKHAFGMMLDAPQQGKRYDGYEPQKYACISVTDDDLTGIVAKLEPFDCYWHTLSIKSRGAYCGITLIPPSSLSTLIKANGDAPHLSQWKELLEKVLAENRWVIHYGLSGSFDNFLVYRAIISCKYILSVIAAEPCL